MTEDIKAQTPPADPAGENGGKSIKFTHKPGGTLLEVLGLKLKTYSKDISLSLRSGEIMGIAGLAGSGKSLLLKALSGQESCAGGIISLKSKHGKAKNNTPKVSLKKGICYLSCGSVNFAHLTPAQNAALPVIEKFTTLGFVSGKKINAAYTEAVAKLEGLGFTCRQTIMKLSRVLVCGSEVVVFDNITAQLDSKELLAFYRLIDELACSGNGIILSGNSADELLKICDTVAVMHNNELCPPRPAQKWTLEEINLYENSGKLGAVSIL